MNLAIKIILKTLMTKIAHISWGVTTKAFTIIKFIKISKDVQLRSVLPNWEFVICMSLGFKLSVW